MQASKKIYFSLVCAVFFSVTHIGRSHRWLNSCLHSVSQSLSVRARPLTQNWLGGKQAVDAMIAYLAPFNINTRLSQRDIHCTVPSR
jgi:hypothetical protein